MIVAPDEQAILYRTTGALDIAPRARVEVLGVAQRLHSEQTCPGKATGSRKPFKHMRACANMKVEKILTNAQNQGSTRIQMRRNLKSSQLTILKIAPV